MVRRLRSQLPMPDPSTPSRIRWSLADSAIVPGIGLLRLRVRIGDFTADYDPNGRAGSSGEGGLPAAGSPFFGMAPGATGGPEPPRPSQLLASYPLGRRLISIKTLYPRADWIGAQQRGSAVYTFLDQIAADYMTRAPK